MLTSPFPTHSEGKRQKFSCAWNCYYCPNELTSRGSYLHDEPAVKRANENASTRCFSSPTVRRRSR